jgi:hypothetical protein
LNRRTPVLSFTTIAFNNSPAGQLIVGATGSGINLDGTQVVEVAAFLRAINALENIRQSIEMLDKFASKNFRTVKEGEELLDLALAETKDSSTVLKGGGLHPEAVRLLRESKKLIKKARRSLFSRGRHAREAIEKQEAARNEIVEPS